MISFRINEEIEFFSRMCRPLHSSFLLQHYLTAPWMFPSMLNTRVQRFLDCMRVCLLAVMIETVIYGVFFPSDGRCEAFRSFKECTADKSMVLNGKTVCEWLKRERKCQTTPMPKEVIFTLLIALVILILMKPVDMVMGLLQEVICAKRPRLELLDPRLITNSWLGSVHHSNYVDESPLALAFVHKAEMERKMQDHGETVESRPGGDMEAGADDESDGPDDVDQLLTRDERDHLALIAFRHLSSPFEELRHIVEGAQVTLPKRYA